MRDFQLNLLLINLQNFTQLCNILEPTRVLIGELKREIFPLIYNLGEDSWKNSK